MLKHLSLEVSNQVWAKFKSFLNAKGKTYKRKQTDILSAVEIHNYIRTLGNVQGIWFFVINEYFIGILAITAAGRKRERENSINWS